MCSLYTVTYLYFFTSKTYKFTEKKEGSSIDLNKKILRGLFQLEKSLGFKGWTMNMNMLFFLSKLMIGVYFTLHLIYRMLKIYPELRGWLSCQPCHVFCSTPLCSMCSSVYWAVFYICSSVVYNCCHQVQHLLLKGLCHEMVWTFFF
jgi:hypothetical protein